jgi:hypothetical protein
MRPRIAICSLAGDLHALRVWEKLFTRHSVACDLIETDRCVGLNLHWDDRQRGAAVVPCRGGVTRVDGLDLIWWRRVNRPQIHRDPMEAAAGELVDRSWQAATLGVLQTTFRGVWVSAPKETTAAENKLLQLDLAREIGLSVPETLVTTDAAAVRSFVAEFHGNVVVKSLKDVLNQQYGTLAVSEDMLKHESAIRMAPSIWQRRISGTRHLRVCVFGSRVITALLSSDMLDWRLDPAFRAAPYTLDAKVSEQLGDMLTRLGLRMGVFDFKLDEYGIPWWLELNPQGQFLFLERVGPFDLLTPFCEFLVEERQPSSTPFARDTIAFP